MRARSMTLESITEMPSMRPHVMFTPKATAIASGTSSAWSAAELIMPSETTTIQVA